MSVSLCLLLMNLMIDVAEFCDFICFIDYWKQLRCALRWNVSAGQIARKCSDVSGELKQ